MSIPLCIRNVDNPYKWYMMERDVSAMNKIIEILAILIFMLLIISVVTMPWPVNIVIGCLFVISTIGVFVSQRRAKEQS